MKGIFLLEMDDTTQLEELEEASPQISRNAIMGISAIEMMKL
jgi:hypothetical protein